MAVVFIYHQIRREDQQFIAAQLRAAITDDFCSIKTAASNHPVSRSSNRPNDGSILIRPKARREVQI